VVKKSDLDIEFFSKKFSSIFRMLKHGFIQKNRFFRLGTNLLWICIPINYELFKNSKILWWRFLWCFNHAYKIWERNLTRK